MSEALIQPIDDQQRAQVCEQTARYVDLASTELDYSFAQPKVLFDLSGTTAGMFRAEGDHCCIRYNPWIFAKYFADNLADTVPHEVAHYIVYQLYGQRRVKPHGSQWQAVMALFGANDAVTFNLDLSGIPQRRQRQHRYFCQCREHEVSTTRHNRIQQGRGQYVCRYCHTELAQCQQGQLFQ